MTVSVLAIFPAFATDRYVSTDGQYGKGQGECYTDLQTAIAAAQAGETVWVKDGFVCDQGSSGVIGPQYDGKGTVNRILIDKAILVRSESGLVDETTGKGATIRGAYGAAASKMDNSSIRAAGVKAGGALQGFILENSSSRDGASGGCLFLVDSAATNCVIRNGYAANGGGVHQTGASSQIVDCIVTNNVTTGSGGGVSFGTCSGCTIAANTAVAGGGCFKVTLATNCTISANVSTGGNWLYGGGGGMGGLYRDCRICDNKSSYGGGGLFGNSNTKYYGNATSDEYVLAYDCTISGNSAPSGGGMYTGTMIGGTVSNNTATAGGGGLWNVCASNVTLVSNVAKNGGGALNNRVTDSILASNEASSAGGGASGCILVRCTVTNNVASYRGGGVYGGTNVNCRIVGNRRTTTASYGGGGAGFDGAFYNCLIADNTSTLGVAGLGFWDSAYSEVVNCTFVNNVSDDGSGDFNWIWLPIVNSIAWKNGGTSKNICGYATNCCFNVAVNEVTMQWTHDGIVQTDPKLVAGKKGAVYPVAKACRNAGDVFPWMSDANDPRSVDIVGAPRLSRPKPMLGCCEKAPDGLMMILR